MILIFDDPELLDSVRKPNVPDDLSEAGQVAALVGMARDAYSHTTRRPEFHKALAKDDVLLREMVRIYGLVCQPAPVPAEVG